MLPIIRPGGAFFLGCFAQNSELLEFAGKGLELLEVAGKGFELLDFVGKALEVLLVSCCCFPHRGRICLGFLQSSSLG